MSVALAPRSRAWVALAVALFLAVAPGQPFVLCFEPDGTVALELAGASWACDGCEEPGTEGIRLVAPVPECCACLDIPVSGAEDGACIQPSGAEPRIDAPLALAPVPPVAPIAVRAGQRDLRRGAPPGPPGTLAHIRTVVLRV